MNTLETTNENGKITLKEQIQQQLKDKGTLSDKDIAAATLAGSPDPVARTAANDDGAQSELLMDVMTQEAMEKDITLDDLTEADKDAFLDAIVNGTRYSRPFSIYNGKVTGVFRSRKVGESRAIVVEIYRQVRDKAITSTEHNAKIRHAMLFMQLAELNQVARPEVAAPLQAIEVIDSTTRKVRVQPPQWSEDMDIYFDNMDESLVSALYAELINFERKYWFMVSKAQDQNFWSPAESMD